MSQAITRPYVANPNDGEVTITAAGQVVSGWQDIRITRGVERVPSDFAFKVTERYPGQPDIVLQPFMPCVVRIGGDTVITGYVDRYGASIAPSEHTVQISGRGKCQDLTDCSAFVNGMQINSGSMVALAQQLAKPFGITATSQRTVGLGTPIQPVPQFNVNLGETPFEILDRIARWAGVLMYEDTAGNLVLDEAGTQLMSSGFRQGVNIEAASVTFSGDERFSTYIAFIMTAQIFGQIPGSDAGITQGVVKDDTVPRYRPRYIISEQADLSGPIALRRAKWEMARRIGRSQAVKLTCDSWRDSAGKLWEPNYLVPLHIPALKLVNQTWLISEVTYRRGEDGTHADLTLMPPVAFSPEPEILQPFNNQIAQALAAAPRSTNEQALKAAQVPGTTVNLGSGS